MIVTEELVDRELFESATGWAMKREGACRGELCVPMPDGAVDRAKVDITIVAQRLGMPVVVDTESGWRAVGPASIGGRALATAEAPDLVLPDLEGSPFHLSSLRGQKVVLVSWAPY